MNTLSIRRLLLVALLAATLPIVSFAQSASAPPAEGWICAPCGHADDDRVYPEPGACPICGMALITTAERRAQAAAQPTVAILLFDGVQIIDYAAPWEIFGQARFRVVTVSPDGGPITTTMGMRVTPDHGFADAPEVDVLLVPGGHVDDVQASRKALEWIRRTADSADYVLSVCNGAFLLAEAGLLNGATATTFYGLLDEFERTYPQVRLVRDQRYTDNGRVLTSAGLSSGIDASLYLVSKIQGMDRARSLALHLEYDWDPAATFARGALADRHLPSLDIQLPGGAELRRMTSLGDENSWEVRWRVEPEVASRVIVEAFASALATQPRWRAVGGASSDRMSWRVATESDGEWAADLRVTQEGDQRSVSTSLERVSK